MAMMRTERIESAIETAKEKADGAKAVVVPAVVTAAHVAREKTGELLASDAAGETRRRARNVLRAATGKPDIMVVATSSRRRGLLWFAAGIAAGGALVTLLRRFFAVPTPPALYDTPATPDTSEMPAGTADSVDSVTVIPDGIGSKPGF